MLTGRSMVRRSLLNRRTTSSSRSARPHRLSVWGCGLCVTRGPKSVGPFYSLYLSQPVFLGVAPILSSVSSSLGSKQIAETRRHHAVRCKRSGRSSSLLHSVGLSVSRSHGRYSRIVCISGRYRHFFAFLLGLIFFDI